jgi:hypothetical protein
MILKKIDAHNKKKNKIFKKERLWWVTHLLILKKDFYNLIWR